MPPAVPPLRASALLLLLPIASALNNGLGLTPPMGWSSWYSAPAGSQVTSAFMRNQTLALVSRGLAAKGYVVSAVDEGWLKGRYPNGTLYEDLEKFPEGMAALAAFINSLETSPGSGQNMRFGSYTCRGTCQCSTSYYSGPGGEGYEAEDTAYFASLPVHWLKVDSCCAPQDHASAFAQYGKWRDGLNATGKPIFFNLCGWNPWYSPPDPSLNYTGGGSLGNSWRIDGDGADWGAITSSMNVMAAQWDLSGPGGWQDADNILGPHGDVGVITQTQAQTQFLLWAIFPTQLILGENIAAADQEFIDTVGNEELIAINQDSPYVAGAQRVVGTDLSWPCAGGQLPPGALYRVQTLPCGGDDAPNQQWLLNATDGSVRLASQPASAPGLLTFLDCGTADGTLTYVMPPGVDGDTSPCGGSAQVWVHTPGNGSLVNPLSSKCLDEYEWTTPRVDLWTCLPGATNEGWLYGGSDTAPGTLKNMDSGYCLTATQPNASDCTNVWARPLSDGGFALAMANNGDGAAVVTCDAACFAASNITRAAPNGVRVRDLLAHADLPTLSPPYSFAVSVPGGGGGAAFRLTPF